jgi:CBS domain-containing protein
VTRILTTDVDRLGKKDTVASAMDTFRKGAECCPVLENGKLVGMLHKLDIAKGVKARTGIRVGNLMTRRPAVAKGSWSVFDVAKLLTRGAFTRLPVVDEGVLLGVVTPNDILSYLKRSSKLGSLRREKQETRSIARQNIVTVEPDDDLSKAAEAMRRNGIGMLPVAEDLELLGVVTDSDILEVLHHEKRG